MITGEDTIMGGVVAKELMWSLITPYVGKV